MEYASSVDVFKNTGRLLVTDFLDKKTSRFLTSYLRHFKAQTGKNAITGIATPFESLLEDMWEHVEFALGKELLPSFSAAILYSNGMDLPKHKDPPSCEITVGIDIGRTHNYSWPFIVDGVRYDLNEGDAVIYYASELQSSRPVCDGPEGYECGMVYLSYVYKMGEHSQHANNKYFYPERKDIIFNKERNSILWMRNE